MEQVEINGQAKPAAAHRRAVLGSLGLTAGSVLAACALPAGQGTNDSPSRPPVTIEYLTGINARQEQNQRTWLIDPFEQTHRSLQLTIISGGGGGAKLTTLVAGGTPPDVAWVFRADVFHAKLTQEIMALVKRDKYNLNVFPKAAFDSGVIWRGKVLGLPVDSGGNWPVMPYNKELFRQAGVPEPPARWGDASWNMEAWLQALQKTTKRSGEGKLSSFGINLIGAGVAEVNWPFMWKTAWLTDDFKTVTCDSPAMVEAMEYLVGLTTRQNVMATGPMLQEAFGSTNAQELFLNGKLAMFVLGGGATFAIAQAVHDQNLPLAYAPLPTFKVVGAGQSLDHNALVTDARHSDEAWTYIKWSADTPNWSISRGNLPARVDQVDAWAKELYPGTLATQMRLDVYKDSLRNAGRKDPLSMLPTYDQMDTEIISPAFNKLVAGDVAVGSTLRDMKTQLQALVPRDLP